MAYFLFTKAIQEGKTIKVFNNGDLFRDFTYIDDIVEGIIKIIQRPPLTPPKVKDSRSYHYKLYNIGNSSPVKLLDFIETIENTLGKKAIKEFCEMHPGDVYKTYADVSDLEKDFGYSPDTSLESGIHEFVDRYLKYFKK